MRQKGKQSAGFRLKSWIFKKLTGTNLSQFQRNFENNKEDSELEELHQIYMFDFLNYAKELRGRSSNIHESVFISSPNEGEIVVGEPGQLDGDVEFSAETTKKLKHKKIAIKPIDALVELETIPTPFSLTLLDEKIAMLKDKAKLISQKYAKRELIGLIERLENRKHYSKHKEFFDKWQNTNDEKIENLLTKYDLVMKSADIFVPEFPDIAIERMKQYSAKVEAICGKAPVYYVIANEELFRKQYERRDPILLVQSPFGFYWQILGAWDAEMLILHEL